MTTKASGYFLQHANTWDKRESLQGRYLSEKLDGMRCFWDGGYSIGKLSKNVIFADVSKDKKDVECTGLWSRLRKVIHAPQWFIDQLPRGVCLDGELVVLKDDGTGLMRPDNHTTLSVVRKQQPLGHEWERVTYWVFDVPELHQVLPAGWTVPWGRAEYNWYSAMDTMRVFDKIIIGCTMGPAEEDDLGWDGEVKGYSDGKPIVVETQSDLTGQTPSSQAGQTPSSQAGEAGSTVGGKGEALRHDGSQAYWLPGATRIPENIQIAEQILLGRDWQEIVARRLEVAHEGLMARSTGDWSQRRSSMIYKIKKWLDGEAIILGFQAGMGKYEGMLGSLICDFNGKRFMMSGMTDAERQLVGLVTVEPGMPLLGSVDSKVFRRGQMVTFKYRYLSADGVPVEPRYHRIRETME